MCPASGELFIVAFCPLVCMHWFTTQFVKKSISIISFGKVSEKDYNKLQVQHIFAL